MNITMKRKSLIPSLLLVGCCHASVPTTNTLANANTASQVDARVAAIGDGTAAVGLKSNYWISTNILSANLGTIDNPYVCTNEVTFDNTMSNMPPNCYIHIMSGLYYTLGSYGSISNGPTPSTWIPRPGYSLKSGQTVIGNGIDKTIIRLSTNSLSGSSVMGGPAVFLGTNIEVSDLTLDGNGQNFPERHSCLGLTLNGTKIAERRVKVENLEFTDNSVNSETWGIGIDSEAADKDICYSKDNIIEECELTHFIAGSGISGLFLNGQAYNWLGQPTNGSISGIIKNNKIYLPTTDSAFAFNGGGQADVLIEGNYVNGGEVGYYQDTLGSTDVLVISNKFNNVRCAWYFTGPTPKRNITFGDNEVTLAYDNPWIAIVLDNSTSFTNISIINNRFNDVNGGSYLFASNVTGLKVLHNRIASDMANYSITKCSGVRIDHNTDLNGHYLPMNDSRF
jgi:hypothetical protein